MFRLRLDHPLDDEIRRFAREQLDKALEQLEPGVVPLDEAVQQMRKRGKKVRAVLRLARPALNGVYSAENRALRDAARLLSPMRDADVSIETWGHLVRSFDGQVDPDCVRALEDALTHRRRALLNRTDVSKLMTRVRSQLRAVRGRVADWPLGGIELGDVLDGMQKTYARGRDALESAYDKPTAARFHEWRKQVKYGRYQVRLMRDLWEDELEVRHDAMHHLSDLLGEEHDLARLESITRDELAGCFPDAIQHLLDGLATQRRAEVRTSAAPLGLRLYAEPPAAFRARLFEYAAALAVDDHPPDTVATPRASLPA